MFGNGDHRLRPAVLSLTEWQHTSNQSHRPPSLNTGNTSYGNLFFLLITVVEAEETSDG